MSRLAFASLAAALLLAAWRRRVAQDHRRRGNWPPRAAPTTHIQVGSLPVMDTTPAFDADQATAQLSGAGQRRGARPLRRLFRGRLLAAAGGPALWPGRGGTAAVAAAFRPRIRDWAEERTRSRTYQVMLYVAAYVAV